MEQKDFRKTILEKQAEGIGKKTKPILRGLITEYNGKEQIGLWPTEEFVGFLKAAIKEAIKEV
jgi:hypothetical protein